MLATRQQTTQPAVPQPARHRAAPQPAAAQPDARVYWQRQLGNRLFRKVATTGEPRLQRACACGGTCTHCAGKDETTLPFQTKLKIGPANDRYEREADRVADTVMRMPEPGLRRQPIEEEEEIMQTKPLATQITPLVQRDAPAGGGGAAPPIAHTILRTPGRPLGTGTRHFMESRFGADFSGVRVHTGTQAEAAARSVQARAYTVGQHVVFGAGEYAPGSSGGKRLLAHELTHVVQQHGAIPARLQRITVEGDCTTTPPAASQGTPEAAPQEGPQALAGSLGVEQAWNRAREITSRSIEILGHVRSVMNEPGGPARLMPSITSLIRRTFDDVGGGLDGSGFTRIGALIGNLDRIRDVLVADNYIVRCVADTHEDCGSYLGAFVRDDTPGVIFICRDRFFGKTIDQRAETLIHELAHAVLNAEHTGTGGPTEDVSLPPIAYDCRADGFEIDYDSALDNAYAYEVLVACLAGSHPRSDVTVDTGESAAAHPGEEAHGEGHGDHHANEIGAYLLVPSVGGVGAEVRYTRVLLGRAPGWEFHGVLGASYLSHGQTLGLGAGLGVRYAGRHLYIQGGAGVEGAVELEHAPPTFHAGAALEAEAGVNISIVRLSAGYRLILPFADAAHFHPGHVGLFGVSLAF